MCVVSYGINKSGKQKIIQRKTVTVDWGDRKRLQKVCNM